MAVVPSYFSGPTTKTYDPFSLDFWDPFQDFLPLTSSALTNVPATTERDTSGLAKFRIDWKETPEAHIFKVDVPGLKKDEVKVEVVGDVLQIRAERKREKEEKNSRWHRLERSFGKLFRRFKLPDNSKTQQVKANMENGVLTVSVPKKDPKKPDVKCIEISS
ncbi:hypothetical protein NE237_007645 [Protea cynaroides]|uniref:SHSP domain-containing protein n=1 Tax=Protea cynaroides TaxID=273540 RepID=A0A9Q0KPT8_9MAGN|nr:hypothetical protein NE237_007645 [Protea cynaroides]